MSQDYVSARPPSRVLLYGVSWPLSAALGILGFYGDYKSWWDNRPYSTNILTTVTGALFGIPIVLDIFRRIASSQIEDGNRKSIHRLLRSAIKDYIDSTNGFIPGSDEPASLDEIRSEISYIIERVAAVQSIQQHAEGTLFKITSMSGHRPDGYYPYMARTLSEFANDVNNLKMLNEKFSLASSAASTKRAEMVATWEYLDVYVRPRVLESGGRWLSPHVQSVIRDGGFPNLRLDNIEELVDDFSVHIKAGLRLFMKEVLKGQDPMYAAMNDHNEYYAMMTGKAHARLVRLHEDLARVIELRKLNNHLKDLL